MNRCWNSLVEKLLRMDVPIICPEDHREDRLREIVDSKTVGDLSGNVYDDVCTVVQ